MNKTKQIYIEKFDYPFESVYQIFLKNDIFHQIFINKDYKLKKFLGSDWSIKDSGFIFYGTNNSSAVYSLINIIKNDFIIENKYRITHLNEQELDKDIYIFFTIIKNTSDNTTIVESRLEFDSEIAYEKFQQYFKLPLLKKIIMKIFDKKNLLFNNGQIKNKDFIAINHSFTIKKNYKEAFNFFYNWNNLAKSIKTDKAWKIITEENDKKYKDFYIVINDNVKVHYQVISIEEINDTKIEIVYNKTNNSFPTLNNYIKFIFFNIAKDLCFFLYETHLPINISSSVFQKVSYYLYYCNKKLKDYIENNK